MISKKAVQQYLEEPSEDFYWIKNSSLEELIQETKLINAEFKTTPFKHQYASFLLGIALKQFLFLLDMGVGKTKIALDCANHWINNGQVKKVLVLVPNLTNIDNWVEEVNIHTDLIPVSLEGTKQNRFVKIHNHGHIYILNYDGLPVYTTELKRLENRKNRKRIFSEQLANRFVANFDMVVFDEIQNARNTTTLIYDLCKYISNRVEYRFGLTGTPIGKNAVPFWAIFNLIDQGESLGRTKTLFLNALFNKSIQEFSENRKKVSYSLKPDMKPVLLKKIKNRSIRYEDVECADIPKMKIIEYPVVLKQDQREVYDNLLNEIHNNKKSNNFDDIINYYNKSKQIVAGFLFEKDENDIKHTITFGYNTKLEALMEILNEIPESRKVVIFHWYIPSGDMIQRCLTKNKIPFLRLRSGNEKAYKRFKDKNAPERVLIVNHESGGTGLNLQVANYSILYDLIEAPDKFQQVKKRIHRTGQTLRTYFYILKARGTIDDRILISLKDGLDLSKELVDGQLDLYNIIKGE